jgi:flagellar biosynthetic protein FliO
VGTQELLAIAFKMTVALGVVLLVFGGALMVFKKFSGSSKNFLKKSRFKGKPIEILAYQSLGPNRALYLVKCLEQKFLIGATGQAINQLSEIRDESDFDFGDSLKVEQESSDHNQPKSRITSGVREIARV